MTAFLFIISLLASAYSAWRVTQTFCDQREANAALAILPAIAMALLSFGLQPYEKLVSIAIIFMAGIAILGETGLRRLIPATQLIFALYLLIAIPNALGAG